MALTELEGVNKMLESIGESSVSSVPAGGNSIERQAANILADETKQVLRKGPGQFGAWSINTTKQTLTPVASQVTVPSGTLKLRNYYGYPDYAIRNGLVYNVTDDTFTITNDITVLTVDSVTFTQLSDALAEYVVASAAVRFQRITKRGRLDDANAQQELIEARTRAFQEDGDMRSNSIFNTDHHFLLKGRRTIGDHLG